MARFAGYVIITIVVLIIVSIMSAKDEGNKI